MLGLSKLSTVLCLGGFWVLVVSAVFIEPIQSNQAERPEELTDEVMQGFRSHCTACHSQFNQWERIVGQASEIAKRIVLDSTHDGPMPPTDSPFALNLSVQLRNKMYQAVSKLGGTEDQASIAEKLQRIQLPDGFKIEVLAVAQGARSLSLQSKDRFYVGTGGFSDIDPEGRVYVVTQTGEAPNGTTVVQDLLRGLENPNGVAYYNGFLYVAERTRIIRLKLNQEGARPEVLFSAFPADTPRRHSWKYIAVGPDEKLYVTIGAPCNICWPESPLRQAPARTDRVDSDYATIARMNLDGSQFQIYARGVRNSVGFDWHPDTKNLWFTDNGRDHLGDEVPADELNQVTKIGQHFGFPYCHAGKVQDPIFKSLKCKNSKLTAPIVTLDAHVAALGMTFYRGDKFPKEYSNAIFIAEHGSWNRSDPIGYRISVVKAGMSSEVFASGWLSAQSHLAWGRPVDVINDGQGGLLISDDKAGLVYRIWYERAAEKEIISK